MSIVDFKSDLSLSSKITDKPTNVVERKLDDIKRITKFTYSTIPGAMFVAKQVGLQLLNPIREATGGLFDKNGQQGTRIYNLGVNTLAQVAVQGTGAHLDRHGLLPINEERSKYYKVVQMNDANGTSKILTLYKRLIAPKLKTTQLYVGNTNNENVIEQYQGGPGSVMGVGDTTITRVFNTTNNMIRQRPDIFASEFTNIPEGTVKKPVINYYQSLKLSTKYFSANKLYEYTGVDVDRPTLEPEVIGRPLVTTVVGKNYFKTPKDSDLNEAISLHEYPHGDTKMKDLKLDYIDKRIGYISPQFDHNRDQVNLMNIYSSTDANAKTNDRLSRDLIKFKVELIDNNQPTRTDVLVFRSYLTAFDDNSSNNMTSIRYVGRGDKFYVADGYDASYSLGFVIYAMSAGEMKPIYNKLNYLKSSLAPDYNGTKMRASLVRMTLGNYMNRVPGYISSLNINIPEDAVWDIDIPFGEQGGTATELPRHLNVQMTFIPIYDHLIRKGRKTPFISVDKLGYLS